MRQPDLTLCLEEVHKPHNVSAVIRSADAVGIHDLHAVWPEKIKTLVSSAAGSNSWVNVHNHDTLGDAVTLLKSQGMQILATHLSDSAVDFRAIDFTRPTCIIMGSEKTGISQEAVRLADQHIMIPMSGMVQSLNVSVAAAVILYEAQRQREAAGLYEHPRCALAQDEQQRCCLNAAIRCWHRSPVRKNCPVRRLTNRAISLRRTAGGLPCNRRNHPPDTKRSRK